MVYGQIEMLTLLFSKYRASGYFSPVSEHRWSEALPCPDTSWSVVGKRYSATTVNRLSRCGQWSCPPWIVFPGPGQYSLEIMSSLVILVAVKRRLSTSDAQAAKKRHLNQEWRPTSAKKRRRQEVATSFPVILHQKGRMYIRLEKYKGGI